MKLLNNKKEKGFIVLTAVILVSALIVLFTVGILSTSVGELEKSTSKIRTEEAFFLANLCLEKAINELRKDPVNYIGNEGPIEIGEGYCNILEIEGDWGSGKIIKTEGVILDYTRNIKVEISSAAPQIIITNWQEVF